MAKVNKRCVVCEAEFECYQSAAERRKTCSRVCSDKLKTTKIKKECAGCGATTTNAKYCSNKCQRQFESKLTQERDRELYEKGELTFRGSIRKILAQDHGYSCSVCGIDKWNNKPITLWVDHIDGNAGNNKKNNLRLICPNCDSQSDTFMAKNKGRGRKSRGLNLY